MIAKTILLSAAITGAALATFIVPASAAHLSGFAVVNSDGSLARGSNVTGASHLSTGIYEVDFSTSVKSCAFTATTGLSGSSGTMPPSFVTVAGRNGNANGVYIRTFDSTGADSDLGFHLNVRC